MGMRNYANHGIIKKYRGKCGCTLQPLNFNKMNVEKILQAREWPWMFSYL